MHLCQLDQNAIIGRNHSGSHQGVAKRGGVERNNAGVRYGPQSLQLQQGMMLGPYLKVSHDPSIKESMSKSLLSSRQDSPDLENFIREIKEKLFRVNKTLNEHEHRIGACEDQREVARSNEEEQWLVGRSHVVSMLEEKNEEIRETLKLEVSKMREEMKREREREREEIILGEVGQVTAGLRENVEAMENQLLNKLRELRKDTFQQFQNLNETFKGEVGKQVIHNQDISNEIISNHEASLKAIADIEASLVKLSLNPTKHPKKPSDRPSQERCLGSFHTFLFKETIQPLCQSPKQPITVSEGTYFIDKQGYLLDKDGFYIVDDAEQWIQLSQEQIKVLRIFDILQY